MQDCGQDWYCNHFQITVERCIYFFRTLSQSILDSYQGFFFGFRNVRHFFIRLRNVCISSCGN